MATPTHAERRRPALLWPWGLGADLLRHRSLLLQFTRREVERRYKGTMLGMLWSFLSPMLMLAVYWVVFGWIFGGSYGHPGETKPQYVLSLFCGLLLFDLPGSSLITAPSLMMAAPNLITKVVFPVEIIPVASIGSAVIHLAAGFLPLIILEFILQGFVPISALAVPLIALPLALYALGLVYLLSALGVFLRDLNSFIPPVVSALMFMSALFYPISAVPLPYRKVVLANPFAILLEQGREAMVFGRWPDPLALGLQLLLALVVVVLGRALFDQLKSAFADVL